MSSESAATDVEQQQQQRAGKSTDDVKDGDEPEYPQGLRMAAIVASLFASIFIVAVSQTVLAAAIPTITSNFKSNDDVAWYSTGEQVSAVALLLPFGRMYALLNNKWVYFFSVVVYLIGSAICGAAPTSTVFIIGRTIQGAGLAGVFGGTFILIARITPLRTRSLYAGLCGAAYAIAAVVGPVIGGAFTSRVSWRWCFYCGSFYHLRTGLETPGKELIEAVNLPIGAVFLVIIFAFLPASLATDSPELKGKPLLQKIMRFDPLGSLILLSCLVCLVLALQWGGAQYAWNSGQVIAVLVVFGCTLIPWLWLQYKQGDEATVPFSLVSQRTVAASCLYLLFLNGSFGIFIFYLPIWFQSIDGDSAEGSGIKQLALSISTAISSIVAGGLVAAIGWYNPFLILGPICSTAGAAMLIKIQPGTSAAYTLGAQILGGVGVGIGAEQANVAVQAVLPPEKISMGTSLTLFTRLLGFALAVPIGQNVLQQALSDRLGVAVAAQIFGGGGVTDIRRNLERIFGAGTPELQGALEDVNFALTQTFLVGLVMAATSFPFSLFVEWKSVKKGPKEDGKEEGTDKTREGRHQSMEMDDMSGKR